MCRWKVGTGKYDLNRLSALLTHCYPKDHARHLFWQSPGAQVEENLWKIVDRFPDFEQAWRSLQMICSRQTTHSEEHKAKIRRVDEGILRCLDARIDRWLTRDLVRHPFNLSLLEGIFQRHNEAMNQFLRERNYFGALKLLQQEQQALALATQFRYPFQAASSYWLPASSGGNTDLRHDSSLRSRSLWLTILWANDSTGATASAFLSKELEEERSNSVEESKIFGILQLLWTVAWHCNDSEGRAKWREEMDSFRGTPLESAVILQSRLENWLDKAPGCASKVDPIIGSPMWDVQTTAGSTRVCSYCASHCLAANVKHFDGGATFGGLTRLCSCDACLRRPKIAFF
jgi:hypothetical protein